MADREILNIAGKEYPIYLTRPEVGKEIKSRKRCAFESTFKLIIEDYDQINDLAGEKIDYSENLYYLCSSCSTGLNFGSLYMMAKLGGQNAMLGGQLGVILEGSCPECGGGKYLLVYDPDGI